MNDSAPSKDYYASQIKDVVDTTATGYLKFKIEGETFATHWMDVNENSAQAIVDALRDEFPTVH